MWLGEQIDEYGIGNGISLLIMAGILARMPGAGMELLKPMIEQAASSWAAGAADRRRDAAGPGRAVRGRGGRRGVHHPGPAAYPHPERQARPRPPRLRRHAAVPAAAGQPGRRDADHLRQQPAAVPHVSSSATWLTPYPGDDVCSACCSDVVPARRVGFVYNVLYVALIYFFCYFWTAITFNPKDMADNLKNYGTFIPGYRPGKRTADYLEKVMVRITYVGAGFLAVVAIIPTIVAGWMGIDFMRGQLLRRHRPADRRERGLRPGAEDRQPPGDAELQGPAGAK